MDTGTWVAIAGSAVSLGAAGAATWQAVVAKGQAQTAVDSAASARRQADAAEQQVLLMQRQIEGEERDRLDADRPVFVAEHGEIGEDDYGQRRVGVRLIQDGGTALSSVRVTVSGTYVEGIRTDADSSGAVSSMDLGSSADGTVHRLWVGVEHEYVSPVTITFRIDSTARDTDATWTRDLALNASPLPDPSPYRSRVTREVVRRPFAP